ncbi:MAG: amidohydrolase [Gammaproteobacteria bacterium]|nr:amidohydrolase [Gammaproteobacteria bacterium]
MNKSGFILLLLFFSACNQQPAPSTSEQAAEPAPLDPATVIYTNADIVTMDEKQPEAEAVAVRDGLILAVGSHADVESLAGNNAMIEDLQGATLLPGLIDAHGHINFTAQTLATANLSSPPVGNVNNMQELLAVLEQQRDNTPEPHWIIGWGYDDSLLAENRHPTREDLDKVSADRPIMIRHVSGHLMSCNSKCLELAGITAEMDDPQGGIIRRLPDSREPDGVLEETAMEPLYTKIPQPSRQQRMAMLQNAQNYYASHGITTVQDGAAQLEDVALMSEAAGKGLLYLDMVAFPYVLFLGENLDQVKTSREYSDHFRVGGMKLVLDGSPQGKTAFLTQPYLEPPHGQKADYRGYPSMQDEQVNNYVAKAFANNIPLLAHANGDAAADQLINAVAAANELHGNKDRRSVMIHAQTAREDQIDAMLKQNIMPSYFSAHTYYWGDWHRDSVFGEERAKRISPLRSSADKGLRYTTHNDTPIVPPDMMRLMWASVNRTTRSGKTLGPEQRATPYEALKSITLDAAYQYFEEQRKGSITVGKLADFTVVDGNPLTVGPDKIKDIKVLQTIKEGQRVFPHLPQ